VASIADIIREGHGKAGSNQSWRCETNVVNGVEICTLWHYNTCMMEWRKDRPTDKSHLYFSLGHGSVSDQGAMNKAFRILGLPHYFSRAGGAQIV
jgi:hypothetical protein